MTTLLELFKKWIVNLQKTKGGESGRRRGLQPLFLVTHTELYFLWAWLYIIQHYTLSRNLQCNTKQTYTILSQLKLMV